MYIISGSTRKRAEEKMDKETLSFSPFSISLRERIVWSHKKAFNFSVSLLPSLIFVSSPDQVKQSRGGHEGTAVHVGLLACLRGIKYERHARLSTPVPSLSKEPINRL